MIDTFPLAILPGLSLGLRMSNYLHYSGTNIIVFETDVEYGIIVGDSAQPGNYCIVFTIKMRDEKDYYRSIKYFTVIR